MSEPFDDPDIDDDYDSHQLTVCPYCNGEGDDYDDDFGGDCRYCGGTGWVD